MAYHPQPGTIPCRAIKHLQSQPIGTVLPNAVLADALGVDKNALHSSMVTPVKHGAIAREKKPDGLIYWSLGNNVPLPPPHDFEPDKPLQAREEPRRRGQRATQAAPAPASPQSPLFCAYSDGRMGIQADGHDMMLEPSTVSALAIFMSRWSSAPA